MYTRLLPVVLLWRDKTLDMGGADNSLFSWIYIGPGRVLTLNNFAPGNTKVKIIGNFYNYGVLKVNRIGDK